MKKQKHKKKLQKPRITAPDATATFMEESGKEVEALGGLGLTPQAPLTREPQPH